MRPQPGVLPIHDTYQQRSRRDYGSIAMGLEVNVDQW